MNRILVALLGLATFACLAAPGQAEYYTQPPQFHFTPDPAAPRWPISRLGPIGLGIELRKPNFTIHITNIEEGSPAASTGQLKRGMIIESINGEVLKDIDPRVQLGNMITKIEAADGKVRLMVKDKPDAEAAPVEFSIPAMGAYSDTWPVDCAKSDRIVREMADWLREQETWGWGAALFMLSTGEQKDLDEVAKRYRERFGEGFNHDRPGHTWSIGYTGIAVCEYYLRTGDKSVLPAVKSMADFLRDTMYNGSWMGRNGVNFRYMAGGHLNAAGLHANTFLLMAKECGVDVDERTLLEGMTHVYRFAGRGNVAYGDHLPEGGMVDNGKVGKLAFTMQAAANLTGKGEDSVYARARDISATKSFYSTSWLFHGHTGGGIGELWRGSAMGLVKDKRPTQYRSFMDERRWMYELARSHSGGFGWPEGQNVSYTSMNDTRRPCGNYIPLIYTMHRKHLRIFGAPPSDYSRTYDLPERPWGTAADEVFYSLEPAEYAPGKSLDISKELLPTHASMPLGQMLGRDDVTDEELLAYAHHIEEAVRSGTVGTIVRKGRYHLIVPLMKSDDPRVRRAALQALTGYFKAPALPAAERTDEMIERAAAMVQDPDESWWVVEAALRVLGMGTPDQVAPHIDRIEHFLNHEEWWLRSAAMYAVAPIVADNRYYKRVMPLIQEKVATNTRAAALRPMRDILRQIEAASPDVQAYAAQTIGKAYQAFPETIDTPGDRDMQPGVDYLLTAIAGYMADVPGGMDILYEVSKERFPDEELPHLDLYMRKDPKQFGSKLKKVFEPLMRETLIWEYVGNNLRRIDEAIRTQTTNRELDGLIDLYQKIGVTDYDWQLWGPARDKIDWDYTTFDPPEKKLWERNVWRYRPVTWPIGAEQWMEPGFDARSAGWARGRAPFAHKDGKLEPIGPCTHADHFCGCGQQPNTFWEKEVLLMRTVLDLPPMKDGHAYRFLVGGRSHVGGGDGSDVWFNGVRRENRRKQEASLTGVGRRVGGQPWYFVVEPQMREHFDGDPVTIAATGFLKLHRSGVKMNHQSFWFEQMKLPTLGEKQILKALENTTLRTAAWQASSDDSDLYQFDGSFDDNPDLQGTWNQVGEVPTIDDFAPDAGIRHNRRARFQELTFKPNGHTNDRLVFHTDDQLLDPAYNQALQITVKDYDGTEYLFIEAGGFRPNKPSDWTPPLYVFKR